MAPEAIVDLPVGVVTFVLTDVEGSTRLWESDAAHAALALASHDAIIESAVTAERGTLLKARGEGDSTFSVFSSTTDALHAVLVAQHALGADAATRELRVRVAVHTGEAELVDGDYRGTVINRAARLRSLAHGGQVLVSRAAAELVRGRLQDGLDLRELGWYRLRDVEQPEQVFQLVHAQLADGFPPLDVAADPAGRGLIGRTRDLAELDGYFAEAARGQGRLVTVKGEAGIGKTRLCEEFVTEVRGRAAKVAWAACWESGGQPALWPWAQLLEQIGESLPTSDIAGDAESGAEARAAMLAMVLESLRVASSTGPLVMILDDVQWADDATLRVVSHLAPSLKTMPVLIVLTRRVDVGAEEPTRLVEIERQARVLHLGGLEEAEVGLLIRAVTGDQPRTEVAQGVFERTAGNPLFARELVGLLHADDRLDAVVSDDALPMPATVRALQSARINRVDERCREMLHVAAAIGDEFRLDLVASALACDRLDVLDLVEDATTAGVLREVGIASYGFTHPLLRTALYDQLRASARVRLHEQIGIALELARDAGQPADLAALSHHFLAAAAGGGAAKAVTYAWEAGHEALRVLAYEEAAVLFERALAALEFAPGAGDRIRLLLDLGAARAAGGGLESSRVALLAAADQARVEHRGADFAAAALGWAGTGFEVGLFDPTQVALLDEALSVLPDDALALRSLCSARLSVALSLTDGEARRGELSAAAVALAREANDTKALAHALAATCDVQAGPATIAPRLRDATEIVEVGRAAGDVGVELLGRRLRLVALMESGDLDGAQAEVELFARAADRLRHAAHNWYIPMWRATLARARGDLSRAEEFTALAAEVSEGAHSDSAEILLATIDFFTMRETGHAAAASAVFDAVAAELSADYGVLFAATAALGHLGVGRVAQAATVIDRVAGELADVPAYSEWLPLMTEFAEAVWELGGHPIAPWLYEALRPFEAACSVEGIGAFSHGVAARHLGMLAAVLGRPEDARSHFEQALAANTGAGAALLVARTLRDWGVALDDRQRLVEARDAYATLRVPQRVAELDARLANVKSEPVAVDSIFQPDGDVWALSFNGTVARIRDSKGVRDLSRLVAQPGREIAALDLAGSPGLPPSGDLGDVIDTQARDAYKARLREIEAELDEADAAGDTGRSDRLTTEREALLAQLSGAYGLGGRARRAGDPAERARTAVTARIKDAIRRIEKVHSDLGRHLARSIRTGIFCVYDP